MIGAAILEFDDLLEAQRLGRARTPGQRGALGEKAGIKYQYDGAGGIWTTMDAMNAALGLPDKQDHKAANDTYSADEVF